MPEIWTSPVRAYRAQCAPRPGERTVRAAVAETDLRITIRLPQLPHPQITQIPQIAQLPQLSQLPQSGTDSADASGAASSPGLSDSVLLDMALAAIRQARAQILNWCELEPAFRTSLSPLPIPDAAPPLVLRMYQAAHSTGVGPFAAVAGVIAQDVAESLAMQTASSDVLVENGGDVYMIAQRDRVVGLLPDPASGLLIGVSLPAALCPVALCASSGRIGHSLSFGQGDLAVIRARDAALADAAATACANMLRTADDVPRMIAYARTLTGPTGVKGVTGVTGVFGQCGGRIGLWGMELAEGE